MFRHFSDWHSKAGPIIGIGMLKEEFPVMISQLGFRIGWDFSLIWDSIRILENGGSYRANLASERNIAVSWAVELAQE